MQEKDHYIVKIEKLDHYGRGVAHLAKKVVFIPYGIPNETVEIKLDDIKKNFLTGTIIRRIETKRAIDVPCPYFNRCGGCHIMHLKEEDQLRFKEQKVKETIQKFANIDPNVVMPCRKTKNGNYRNKVTFHIENGQLGFFKEKSHTLIPITTCFLLHPEIERMLYQITNVFQKNKVRNIESLMIRVGESTKETMVAVEGKAKKSDVITYFKDVKCTSLLYNNEVLNGKKTIEEEILGKKFSISKNAFFQINKEGATILYSILIDEVKNKNYKCILDLYCGTGTIGILLSPYVEKVIGIEVVKEAVENAENNAKQNQVSNIDFLEGKVESIDLTTYGSIDLAIVDPPRKGLETKTIEELKRMPLAKLIYVSCNVSTLARDLLKLKEVYEVKKIIPIDMFKNTYHVECVCVLNRR